jgi:hypothetical protein
MTDRVGEQKLYNGVSNGKKPGIYTSITTRYQEYSLKVFLI